MTPFQIEPYRRDAVSNSHEANLAIPFFRPQVVTWEGFTFKRPAEHCWFSLADVPGLHLDVFCRRNLSDPEVVTFDSPKATRYGGHPDWDLTDHKQVDALVRGLLIHYRSPS